MSQDYIWITESSRLLILHDAGGVPNEIVLPALLAPDNPARLAGSRICLAFRDAKSTAPHSILRVLAVERFLEGASTGDFLLTIDTARSFRLRGSTGTTTDAETLLFEDYPDGLTETRENLSIMLGNHITSLIQIRFTPPPNNMISRLRPVTNGSALHNIARQALKNVTQALPLEEIWEYGRSPRLGPFAHFAYRLALLADDRNPKKLAELLKSIDPVIQFINSMTSTAALAGLEYSTEAVPPTVDLDLTPINPESLFAREFVAHSANTESDLFASFEKTTNAEFRHQFILRELSARLIFCGLKPLQSRSIDLVIETTRGLYILFEVKSISSDNAISQVAKGIFQLHAYAMEIERNGGKLEGLFLVIETAGQEMDKFLSAAAARTGINLLSYRSDFDWPGRLISPDGSIQVPNVFCLAKGKYVDN